MTTPLYKYVDDKAETTQQDIWQRAKAWYGGADNVLYEVAMIIWGPEVVDAKRVSECPECGWAGDVFVLCPYHKDRECPDCGGISGTLTPCTCL